MAEWEHGGGFSVDVKVLPLLSPKCGGEMRIIAFITEGPVIREIPGHPGESTSPPRLRPARGPPLWEMPGSEPGEFDPQAQPEPNDEFDQRIAWQGNRRTVSLVGGDSSPVATEGGFSGSFSTTFKIDHN